MRIVSGIYGGRRLIVPKGRDIRPTSDKVRGAVFNMLRSRGAVEGAQVLDVFCGTGALGLEAISQGAAFCTFIDKNRDSLNLAKQNVTTLGAENESHFILKDAAKLGQRPEDIVPAALAFLDPPYKMNLVVPALAALHGGGWLAKGALLVIEAEKGFNEPFPPSFKIVDTRSYGETQVMLALVQ